MKVPLVSDFEKVQLHADTMSSSYHVWLFIHFSSPGRQDFKQTYASIKTAACSYLQRISIRDHFVNSSILNLMLRSNDHPASHFVNPLLKTCAIELFS